MSKSIVFPYGIIFKEGGRVDVFPAARITFFTKKGETVSLILIVDSGAAVSALPKSDASFLGVVPEGGNSLVISGVGGEDINGWQHRLPIQLGKETLEIPVVFLDYQFAPRVLGRDGIFENFILVFEEKKHRTGFIKAATIEAKTIQKVLARLES